MILIIIIIFALTAYSTNENLGSPSKVYDLLVEAAKAHPVAGNAEGSYLTMRSKEGAIFFVINIVGNFGTVFVSSLPSPLSLPTALANYNSLMKSIFYVASSCGLQLCSS